MKQIFLICMSVIALLSFTSCNKGKDNADKEVIETATPTPTQSVNSIVSAEEYVGEYNSYDVDEPDLEIKRNEDGTYTIQIGIYRLVLLDECVGEYTEEGISFSTNELAYEPICGTITLKDDVATVCFTSKEWLEYSDLTEYQYYKVSDVPKIKDYNY